MTVNLRESGTLPVGVEIDGRVHRDFTLRPRLVCDSVEVMEEPRAQTNDAYRGVALTARQIERLGDLPAERITTELLMTMHDVDLGMIMEAASRLDARLLRFRAEDAGRAAGASGAHEDRGAVASGT